MYMCVCVCVCVTDHELKEEVLGLLRGLLTRHHLVQVACLQAPVCVFVCVCVCVYIHASMHVCKYSDTNIYMHMNG